MTWHYCFCLKHIRHLAHAGYVAPLSYTSIWGYKDTAFERTNSRLAMSANPCVRSLDNPKGRIAS